MITSLLAYVIVAVGFDSTVYGFGEHYCGDLEPAPCDATAITASGEAFDPDEITAAVPMPRNRLLRAEDIYLQIEGGDCVKIHVNDKKHDRYINAGGLDLSVGAVRALTGKTPPRHWSGKVYLCQPTI